MKVFILAAVLVAVHAVQPTIKKEDVVFPEPCWNEKSQIPTYMVNGAPVFESGSFVPKCNDHGLYAPIQCHGQECWCVTSCGNEIPNTRTSGWPTCTEDTPPCTDFTSGDFTPECDKKGYFKSKQCQGNECWCVNKCGTEIEATRTIGNPRCKRFFYQSETKAAESVRTQDYLCAGGVRPDVCDTSVCDTVTCHGYENVKCKPNKCKGCVLEFFTSDGNQVSCNNDKIGVCPTTSMVKLLAGDQCTTECMTDNDCNGAHKCCSNSCGTRCVPPKMDKHGSCPVPITIEDDTCTTKCNIDNDCGGDNKCCSNGCGKVCVTPKPKVRPGSCPATRTLLMGSCTNDCTTDTECRGTQKCCQTVCGTSCVAPKDPETENNHETEVCPAVPKGTVGTCVNRCEMDSECETGEKCCSNGCGRRCMKSVEKATPPCWAEVDNMPTTTYGGISVPVVGTHVPACDATGFHTPKQCHASSGECWCVDKCGVTIEGTRTKGSLTCEPKETPCHDEKKEQNRGVIPRLIGGYRVRCMEDGLYESKQCHGSTCWCTDKCGNEIPNTKDHITKVQCECPNEERSWNCAKNPCDGVTCPTHPDAVCKTNMCGGCKAEFWRGDEKVDCKITKQGMCPVTTDMPSTCVTECSTDGDCTGTRKCCNNGCAAVCVSPIPEEKHGSCPAVSMDTIGSCVTECDSDTDCHDNKKCCFNGCGRTCTPPKMKVTKKYGTCPATSWLTCDYTNECSVDDDCTENRKCCDNGCGNTCTSPVTIDKYGQCPHNEINSRICNAETVFRHECEVDDQCPDSRKCCMQGCNRVCVDVWTTVKDGQCPRWTPEEFEECTTERDCTTDDDCLNEKKCCNTPCGGMNCRAPITGTTDTCEYNGVTRVHGDVWQPDKCTTCRCWSGKTKCTAMTCPVVDYNCEVHPVEGECCPTLTCEKTIYEFLMCELPDGTKHSHGETWQADKCTECTCMDGDIWCSKYTCSTEMTVNKPGCRLVDSPQTCCPEVVCEDRCVDHQGNYRHDNDRWYVDSCTSCTCRNNQVTCTSQQVQCPKLTVFPVGCYFEEVKGQCCPNVVCRPELPTGRTGCYTDGKAHGHGSQWWKDNAVCRCNDGMTTCEPVTSVNCEVDMNPELEGCTRIFVEGKTCPEIVCNTEQSCNVNGETHKSGEVWRPDTCTTCSCDKGEMNCLVTNCPQVGPGCTARFTEGQCCPEISCPTYHHVAMCNSTGVWHTDGETWTENECDVCTCHNGLTTCNPIECPSVTASPGCHVVYENGHCCPVKVCRGSIDVCEYQGRQYNNGDKFTISTPDINIDDLHTWSIKMVPTTTSTCTCVKGRVSCMVNVCPEVRPDCRADTDVEDSTTCPTIVCPEKRYGICPIPDVNNVGSCVSECDADTECSGNTKCCYNGCGLTCTKPVLQGCFDSVGVKRSNGDIWYKDQCTVCECLNDHSICTETRCPDVPSGCTVKPITGQCCGEVVCNTPFTRTCSYNNKNYREGSTWVVDSCTTCKCTDGKPVCTNQICPITNVPGCRPVYVPGKCCPEKVCKEPNSCEVNNKLHLNGESWFMNSCNKCTCIKGEFFCTETKCQELKPGCHYVNTESPSNKCCKDITCTDTTSENTCEVDGVTKNSGDVWEKDVCTTCTCTTGKTTCTTTTCPKISLRPGCRIVQVPGQCCPEVSCRDVHSCIVNGVEHRNGEQWMSDDCTVCRCEHGHNYCTTKTCAKPTTDCVTKDYKEPGKCCPDIVCPYESSTEWTCNARVDDVVKTFKNGETWMRDDCTSCTCNGGVFSCKVQTCPMTVSPGCRTIPTVGQCCPNIVCDPVKVGQCPVVNPFMSRMVTTDTCSSDTDCPGRTKCCYNGKAETCMAAWIVEKPGVCPVTNPLTAPLRTRCSTECTTDMDCVNNWKCCTDGGCSMVCRPPNMVTKNKMVDMGRHGPMTVTMTTSTSMLTGTTKAGECPNMTPYGWNFGRCVTHCNVDTDCPNDNKCCSNGCGAQCMPPKNTNKVGTCPFVQMTDTCNGVVDTCTGDEDCTGNNKCCDSGCGKQCVVPDVETSVCQPVPSTCTKVCSDGYATNVDGCEICKCKKPKNRCSAVMCMMYCPYTFATDTEGCDVCKCKKPVMPSINMMSPVLSTALCKPITSYTCTKTCSNGYATDSKGCEVCACRKHEDECTPMTSCIQYCAYGYATNTDGCDRCTCKQPTIALVEVGICTPLTEDTCDKVYSCPHGFGTNSQGCEVCKCKKSDTECATVDTCTMKCPFGMATDDTGCDVCKCKIPTTCQPVTSDVCNKDCPFGYSTNMFGCEVCKCKQPDNMCTPVTTETCTIKETCAFGLSTDVSGCQICKCKMPTTCSPLSALTCKLNCPYGMATDTNGCETCMCKKPVHQCSPVTNKECKKICPFGLATDRQGCEVCTCKQPDMVMDMSPMNKALAESNTMMCKPVNCDLYCENGFATDMLGCETCTCKVTDCPVRIDKIECPMMELCPYGLATNMKGCEICQCKQPVMCTPVTPLNCPETCNNGYATDTNGCEVCSCKKPILECVPMTTIKCLTTCTYGYATDRNGCETCKCKQPTSTSITLLTTPMCPPVKCRMYCVNGWATDEQGCEICQCQEKDKCLTVTDEVCPMKNTCPYGLATNSDGCEICKCRLPVTCNPIDRTVCPKNCVNGFATTTNGCETCKCKVIPVVDKTHHHGNQVCPIVDANTYGICVTECDHDNECSDSKICCSNGCGTTCTQPVSPDSVCTPVTKETCKLNCFHGLATNVKGCEVCKCKVAPIRTYQLISLTPTPFCKPVTEDNCGRTCTHGFATDSWGCEVCQCRTHGDECSPVTERDCPDMVHFPFGLATDENGCDVCVQRQPVPCTPNTCTQTCVNGYATDTKGCEICKCKKPMSRCVPVHQRICPLMVTCPSGLATDENGCNICKCKVPNVNVWVEGHNTQTDNLNTEVAMTPNNLVCDIVTPLSCHKNCEFGYVTCTQGCAKCMCRKNPQECPMLDEQSCPWKDKCPYGMATDSQGCEICMCAKPVVCPPINTCNTECEFGYATDKTGCERCMCKKSPTECTPVNPVTCKQSCPFGLATDRPGCEICKCKQPTIIIGKNYTNPLYWSVSGTHKMSTVIATTWIPSVTCTPVTSMTCSKTCSHGYMTNKWGCDICECKQPSSECATMSPDNDPMMKRCEWGVATNTEGCQVAMCKHPSVCENNVRTTCQKICVNSYATDNTGCEICECKKPATECPPFTCDKNLMCSFGWATDYQGCETCMCKQPVEAFPYTHTVERCVTYTTPKLMPTTSPQSPYHHVFSKMCTPVNPVTCTKTCTHGYATDVSGCETCKCRKSVTECPNVDEDMCPKKDICPYGLATNNEGCDICECKKATMCAPINDYTCPKVCPYGYATDHKGCTVCQCLNTSPTCVSINPYTCPKTCKYGYSTDSEGCPTCQCRQPTSKIGISLKTFIPDMETCPRVECDLNCPNGYTTDTQGCNLCSCRKAISECVFAPMCSETCPLGYETTTDGCPLCTCKKPKICPTTTIKTCRMACPNGFATDIHGCQVCKCKQTKKQCTNLKDMGCEVINKCPFGLSTDPTGCDVCQCKIPPLTEAILEKENIKKTCTPVTIDTCSESCLDYATNADGCDICKCKRPVSECSVDPTCDVIDCPWGRATDGNGCEICACKKPLSCPVNACSTVCSMGYATDKSGCETCHCKWPMGEGICDVINSDNCPMTCPLGLATDERNCEICKCKNPSVNMVMVLRQMASQLASQNTASYYSMSMMRKLTTTSTTTTTTVRCPEMKCMQYCSHGYVEDPETGCQTCTCKLTPKLGCPAVSYGTVGMCVNFCQDDNECPSNSLCCSNGCGKTCMKATTTECIDEEGESRSHGDIWQRDSCTRCSCVQGEVKCTTMECQPAPENCQPVYQNGQCCPTFECPKKTCDNEGEMWMDDVCTNCTCHNGVTKCMSQSCPKIKPWCEPVYKDDNCCPDMKCTGCMSDTNNHYDHGQTWNEDQCTTCVCQHGQSLCTSMSCPAPKPGCKVIPKDGQCCPTVVCDKDEDKPCMLAWKSVPTMMLMGEAVPAYGSFVPVCDINGYFNATQCHALTGLCWCVDKFGKEKPGTHTRNGMPQCEIETCMDPTGQMYTEGEQWKNNKCDTCTCVNGLPVCKTKTCPAAPADNCITIETEDHCCPQYFCNDHCIDINNKRHEVYESWQLNSCTQCTCYEPYVACRKQSCPQQTDVIPDGCKMVYNEGECCPTRQVCNDECPMEKPVVNCIRNPCDGTVCSNHPNAKCRANYCGGCKAEFYDEMNNKLMCTSTETCRSDVVKTTHVGTETIPRCTPDGYYSAKQCDNTAACWCVDRTGEMKHNTWQAFGDLVTCEEEKPCIKAVNHNQDRLNRGLTVTSDPRCDDEGWYTPEQCNPITNLCWCSENDGTEITGSRKPAGKKLNCNKACFGEKFSGRCSLVDRCDGDSFCHNLPNKVEGYCCKRPAY